MSDPVILLRDRVYGAVLLEEKTAKSRMNLEGETYHFAPRVARKIQTPSKKLVYFVTFRRKSLIRSACAL